MGGGWEGGGRCLGLMPRDKPHEAFIGGSASTHLPFFLLLLPPFLFSFKAVEDSAVTVLDSSMFDSDKDAVSNPTVKRLKPQRCFCESPIWTFIHMIVSFCIVTLSVSVSGCCMFITSKYCLCHSREAHNVDCRLGKGCFSLYLAIRCLSGVFITSFLCKHLFR